MPVCTLTACNGRLCRWGEGQKKIQDVHRYIAQNFKRLSLEAASTFQVRVHHLHHLLLCPHDSCCTFQVRVHHLLLCICCYVRMTNAAASSTFQLAGNLADSSTLAKIALGAPAPAVH